MSPTLSGRQRPAPRYAPELMISEYIHELRERERRPSTRVMRSMAVDPGDKAEVAEQMAQPAERLRRSHGAT